MMGNEKAATMESPTPLSGDQTVLQTIREHCQGVTPLNARLEPWQINTLASGKLQTWVHEHGSPLNVLCTAPLLNNIGELTAAAKERQLDFRVYFARKSNKCLSLAAAAGKAGAGIDVASEQELTQSLEQGTPGRDLICTAAIKSTRLLELCVTNQVTIALDNADEVAQVRQIAGPQQSVNVALRLSGFHHNGEKLHSRFGFDVDSVQELLAKYFDADGNLRIDGLHFHLDGYSAAQRVVAIAECLAVIDHLRAQGHRPRFLDIGGGLPMSYLENETQWNTFWAEHRKSLLGKRDSITYRNHGLGLFAVDGKLHGARNCYPYFQSPTRAAWLQQVLDAPCENSTIASAVRERGLQLRCEPGRSILDGCGMTVAQVRFRKQHPSGDWYIGLAMNRTQCRTSSDDFLVDPLLLPGAAKKSDDHQAIEGYLVGAYCMEFDLLTLRKLRFPHGIAVGDLIVFPNTAGYLMHFMESRSHQFPLANNLIVGAQVDSPGRLDGIDLA